MLILHTLAKLSNHVQINNLYKKNVRFLNDCRISKQNESTPTNKTPKFRHAPTPKISERKKKLFEDGDSNSNFDKFVTVVEEEDSDLGPMSELQFSSSPTNFNKIMGGRATGNLFVFLLLFS